MLVQKRASDIRKEEAITGHRMIAPLHLVNVLTFAHIIDMGKKLAIVARRLNITNGFRMLIAVDQNRKMTMITVDIAFAGRQATTLGAESFAGF